MKLNLSLMLIMCIIVLIALLKYVLSFFYATSLLLSAGVMIVLLIALALYTMYLLIRYSDRRG